MQVLRLFATLWVMTDSKYLSLHTHSSLAASPQFSPFSRFLAVVLALPPTFGLPPPEFSQAGLHLFDRLSAPILTPFLWLLLSLPRLLSLKISVAVLPLFRFLTGRPPTFSRLDSAMESLFSLVLSLAFSVVSSTCDIL